MTEAEGFTWHDGERVIRFGRGALADAPALLGGGWLLLATPRAREAAPELVAAAGRSLDVPAGRVDELAAAVLDESGDIDPAAAREAVASAGGGIPAGTGGAVDVVALGGGRVVDVAKAVAAARGGLRVGAVPTTLSAAEMTRVHRHAAGVPASTPRVRPAVVVNDPALCASQPEADLAASAANALGHAAEGPATTSASPVPALAGREAARLIGVAYAGDRQPDRDVLALAALLSGYAIDAQGYGLHHVLSQTLARMAGVGHGPANAAMLPHTLGALARRGAPTEDLVPLAVDLAARAGASRLRDHGVGEEDLGRCAEAASARAELAHTPPAAEREEILALYHAAW